VTAFKLRAHNDPEKKNVRTIKYNKDPLGFFGITHTPYIDFITEAGAGLNVAYAVEGEFDQLSIFEGQAQQNSFDSIFLALGGGGNAGVNALVKQGFTKVYLIGDDDAGGEKFVSGILERTDSQNHRVFKWPLRLKDPRNLNLPVDPDSAVKRVGFATAYAQFVNDDNYINVVKWAVEKIDTEINALTDATNSDIKKIADNYLNILKTDKHIVKEVAYEVANSRSSLTVQELIGDLQIGEDSQEGLILRIMEHLKSTVTYLYRDQEEKETLYLFHEKKKKTFKLKHTAKPDRAIKEYEMLETNPEGIVNWVRDNMGLPSSYPDIDGTPGAHFIVTTNVRSAVKDAFDRLAVNVPKFKDLVEIGSGIHYIPEEKAGYIVTGNDA
jgi:hypothetical protein